jgi:sigma-B regulation protein RsbU (phosphoserine phosphatase)
VTLVYAELEPASGRLAYANCGHVPPLLSGANGSRRLTAGGPPLGLLPQARYDSEVVTLRPGERLTCVTDGVTEALDPGEEEFGDARAAAELAGGGAAAAVVERLWRAVLAWTGGRGPSDDLTILTLRREER